MGGDINPCFGIALEPEAAINSLRGSMRANVVTPAAGSQPRFDVRCKIPFLPLTRRVKAEICGNCQLPMPAAEFGFGSNRSQLAVGKGELHLHLAQMNLICYL